MSTPGPDRRNYCTRNYCTKAKLPQSEQYLSIGVFPSVYWYWLVTQGAHWYSNILYKGRAGIEVRASQQGDIFHGEETSQHCNMAIPYLWICFFTVVLFICLVILAKEREEGRSRERESERENLNPTYPGSSETVTYQNILWQASHSNGRKSSGRKHDKFF